MSQPELARALVRWQRAAGPYWPYVGPTPFLADPDSGGALDRPPGLRRPPARAQPLVETLAALSPGEPAAFFVDLPPTATLPAAPALNRLGLFVVPVIQRWITARAVLPGGRLLSQLAGYSHRIVRPREARGVVFLLDGDRAGPTAQPGARLGPPRRFDNRYGYPLNPFPPPSFLQQHGVTAVRWVSSKGIAADLRLYAQRLAEAGLEPELS